MLHRISFVWVDELWSQFDRGFLCRYYGQVELVVPEHFGVGFGSTISNYSQIWLLYLKPDELSVVQGGFDLLVAGKRLHLVFLLHSGDPNVERWCLTFKIYLEAHWDIIH